MSNTVLYDNYADGKTKIEFVKFFFIFLLVFSERLVYVSFHLNHSMNEQLCENSIYIRILWVTLYPLLIVFEKNFD